MKTEEEIRSLYFRRRQVLEEQAADLYHFEQKGKEETQKTFEAISYKLMHKEGDFTEILAMARRELGWLEEAYQEEIQKKKQDIRRKEEQNEQHFRQELQQLERNK